MAIASDLRFGQQQSTIATNFDKCFKMHDHLYVAMSGLATDIMTVSKELDVQAEHVQDAGGARDQTNVLLQHGLFVFV